MKSNQKRNSPPWRIMERIMGKIDIDDMLLIGVFIILAIIFVLGMIEVFGGI